MKDKLNEKLTRYIEAGFPILYLHTYEEEKADAAIRHAARETQRRHIQEWNGCQVVDFSTKCPMDSLGDTLTEFLDTFLKDDTPNRILVLKEPQAYLEQPEVRALLRDIALRITTEKLRDCTVVIVSSSYAIPGEIEHYITVLESDVLSYEEIRQIVQETAQAWDAELTGGALEEMGVAFKGLAETEIRNILALAFNRYEGILDHRALRMIFEQKQQTIRKSGILEMVELRSGPEDIGGLDHLKRWLERKASIFKSIERAKEFGVDMPKGVLIAGVPGCGKSLSAKAAASMLAVPLLRMDMGRLLGKYVGESESNMRKAIALAEAISPCVLWIDEMEKAFAGVGGEGGGAEVTTRLLGTFLTWLQEKESPVFVVATANDIRKLPTELMRKGRFDEIFYVDLPSAREREKILEIHMKKRRPGDLSGMDLPLLARETDGYSGADLEGVVRDSVEAVFAAGRSRVNTEDIRQAIRETHSLSEIMGEPLKKMREQYRERKYKNASA